MDKKEWLISFNNNIYKYDNYEIKKIDSRCYELYPCKHMVMISFCNQEYELLLSSEVIANYQKHHRILSLHFMDYVSNNKN